LIEIVERTNAIIVYLQQQTEFVPRCDLYAIDVDRERNYYNCRDFGHISRYCRK